MDATTAVTRYTLKEWQEEAARLFGSDAMLWRFVCPVCGHVQSVQDYKDAGAVEGAVAFSCIGRWVGTKDEGPCDYAGGGLFRLNPITVVADDGVEHHVFEFDRGQPKPARSTMPVLRCWRVRMRKDEDARTYGDRDNQGGIVRAAKRSSAVAKMARELRDTYQLTFFAACRLLKAQLEQQVL